MRARDLNAPLTSSCKNRSVTHTSVFIFDYHLLKTIYIRIQRVTAGLCIHYSYTELTQAAAAVDQWHDRYTFTFSKNQQSSVQIHCVHTRRQFMWTDRSEIIKIKYKCDKKPLCLLFHTRHASNKLHLQSSLWQFWQTLLTLPNVTRKPLPEF